ncbi:MAG TPA: ELWxxDGT repeat protein, partial [Thermoanaerobaculia bacterium]|nr:ELWxxDGT repeat protein [Thermoanaerobaculia bacterium]
MDLTRFCCAFLLLLLTASSSRAATASLVEDINPGTFNEGSGPASFLPLDSGVTLFLAEDGETGRELWRSDGTAAGTFQVLDACDGPCFPRYDYLGAGGNQAFFFTSHRESLELFGDLWVTSGTPGDTFQLAEGLIFNPDVRPVWVPRLRLLFFVADDGEHGFELWRSDGTAAGTYQVLDLVLGRESGSIRNLTAFKGRLFFAADDGVRGRALWVSDGTAAGTRLFHDPLPGELGPFFPELLRVVGSQLLFFAPTPSADIALWRSDGTRPGTRPFFNLVPVTDSSSAVHAAVAIGQRLYFIANTPGQGEELWTSDGTAAGTHRLTNHPEPFAYVEGQITLPVPAPGGRGAFLASDAAHGLEPWLTDGTPAGTRVIDVWPGLASSGTFLGKLHGDHLYFTADDGTHGREMWVSDGTVAGTRLLRDLCPGECPSNPGPTRAFGQTVLFTVHRGPASTATRFFRTDGTPRGTVRFATFPLNMSLDRAAVLPKATLFAGLDAEHRQELWRTDGTRPGTGLLKDIRGPEPASSFPSQLTRVGDQIVFLARPDSLGPTEIWQSDGTAAGTVRRSGFPDCVNQTLFLEVLGGDPIFSCGHTPGQSLWRATPGEPVRLTPPHVTVRAFDTAIVGGSGGTMFFAADERTTGTELWKTDGTLAGTSRVLDIFPGAASSEIAGLTPFQGRVWFSALPDHSQGKELWSSDGTAAGTRPLRPDLSAVEVLGVHLGRLWFAADGPQGRELWSTDGTEAGTRVLDLVPG